PPPRADIGTGYTPRSAHRITPRPKLSLGPGIEDIEGNSTPSFRRLARAELFENGKSRNFPHRGMRPRPVKMQFVLSVDFLKLMFGKAEVGEPVDELWRKHLSLAVEGITGTPHQLLLAEPDGAGVIELCAKLPFIDHLGEPYVPAAIDDRKGDAPVRVEFTDHLQHQ